MVATLSLTNRIILFFILVGLFFLLVVSLVLPVLFTLVIVNFLLLYALVLFLLVYLDKGNFGRARKPKEFGSVTILVPVYNSIGTIRKCVKFIKNIEYPGKLDLVFVDDGSTDGSREFLEKVNGIKLIKLAKNSGKSIAMNTAIKNIKTEFVVCIDSDTYPEKKVLLKTMGYFEDEKVGAVTCLLLPDSKKKFIERLQFFEYLTSFGLWANVLSYMDSMALVPGPMTVFKRKIFDEIGLYDNFNLAEDMEIGLRLQKFGYKLKTCYEAVTETHVPSSWDGLFKQRNRWYRGRVYNLLLHKSLFFNTNNVKLGFFFIPYLFFLELVSVVLLVRIAFFSLTAFSNKFVAEVIAFSASNTIFVGIPSIFVTSTFVFFVFSYFFVFLYLYFSLKLANYSPRFSDLGVILIYVLIYPLFVAFVYGQSFLKELLGVRTTWVRGSL